MQGLISIDCASISIEDNAAPTILIACIADTPIGNNQGMTVRSGCEAAARTTLSIADSGCQRYAGCGDTAAANGDVATRTLASAADSGCTHSAGCGDIAAVDGDCAARTTISAADSGCIFSTGCGDTAAVDGDCAARSIKSDAASAADARAAFATVCGHFATVDGNCACSLPVSAADARTPVAAVCGQPSRVFPDRLGINGKTVALCHIDAADAAVDGQSCAIRQNQADIPGNGDEFINCYIAVDHIPAVTPCGRTAVHHSVVSTFLGFPVLPIFITGSVRNRWRW